MKQEECPQINNVEKRMSTNESLITETTPLKVYSSDLSNYSKAEFANELKSHKYNLQTECYSAQDLLNALYMAIKSGRQIIVVSKGSSWSPSDPDLDYMPGEASIARYEFDPSATSSIPYKLTLTFNAGGYIWGWKVAIESKTETSVVPSGVLGLLKKIYTPSSWI